MPFRGWGYLNISSLLFGLIASNQLNPGSLGFSGEMLKVDRLLPQDFRIRVITVIFPSSTKISKLAHLVVFIPIISSSVNQIIDRFTITFDIYLVELIIPEITCKGSSFNLVEPQMCQPGLPQMLNCRAPSCRPACSL